MDRETIAKRVIAIVSEQLTIDESKINIESSFVDDLNADSLDRVEMVMAFEEDFGFEISTEESESIVTIKDAVNFIEIHMNKKNS